MKENIPEKGAIVQRDRETYAVKAHLPGGFTSPADLRTIADLAERHGIKELKITGAQRFLLLGIPEEKIDQVRLDLGELAGGATGPCVRYVKFCPGATWCKRAQRVTIDIGRQMDERYHRLQAPWKFKMAVSGCPNDCSEACIKDVSMIGSPRGWNIFVGGNGGGQPRFAQKLLADVPSDVEALDVVERVVSWFTASGGKCRIGKTINEMGIEAFRKEIL